MARLTLTYKTKEQIEGEIGSNLISLGAVIALQNNHHRLWYIFANDNDLQQLFLNIYGQEHMFRIEGAPTLNEMFVKVLESYQDISIEDCAFSISYISRLDENEEFAALDMTFTKIYQMYGRAFDFKIEIP
jgi:hypothetical protein